MLLTALESPSHVTRTWGLQRAAPSRKVVTKVIVRSLYIREGFQENDEVKHRAGQMELGDLNEDMTVSEVKRRIMHKLHISPRKILTLRWWGSVMDDTKTLHEHHVAEGGLLELSLQTHSQAALLPLRLKEAAEAAAEGMQQQVRVRIMSGQMVVLEEVAAAEKGMFEPLGASTTAGAIKRTIVEGKLFGSLIDAKNPPPMELCYSPCFVATAAPVFGNNMQEESTLGQHNVLRDDLLYLRLPPPPKEDPKDAKGGKKKK